MVDKNAQALGRKAAGKPKNFSAAERKRRAARLAAARAKRWLSKSNNSLTVAPDEQREAHTSGGISSP